MAPRRLSLGLLLVSLLVPACGEESPDRDLADQETDQETDEEADDDGDHVDATRAARSAIVGGAADGDHPAVVALTVGGQAFCSGTLIAPTVVLTAAHCFHEDFVGTLPTSEVRVFFGDDVVGAGTFLEVTEVRMHADFAGDVPGRQEDDLALVHLVREAPVEPMALGAAPAKGDDVTVVGFGRAAADVAETGVKRTGASRVAQVAPKLLVMKPEPGGTCLGDSGGPALARVDGVEVIVGVHTRSDCRSGMIEERVDAHLDGFLRDVAAVTIADLPGEAREDGHDLSAENADEEPEDEVASPVLGGCTVTGASSSSPAASLVAAAIAALSVLRRRQHDPRRG